MDVPMEPGDLLYLPRGQYHDALADEGGAVHIAFGVTYPIGIDVMALLYERVVAEPEFRANLPRRDAARRRRPARRASRRRLAERLSKVLADPETAQQIAALQQELPLPAPRATTCRTC